MGNNRNTHIISLTADENLSITIKFYLRKNVKLFESSTLIIRQKDGTNLNDKFKKSLQNRITLFLVRNKFIPFCRDLCINKMPLYITISIFKLIV